MKKPAKSLRAHYGLDDVEAGRAPQTIGRVSLKPLGLSEALAGAMKVGVPSASPGPGRKRDVKPRATVKKKAAKKKRKT